jgi:hypothetical protein
MSYTLTPYQHFCSNLLPMPTRPYTSELEFMEFDITMFCFMPNNIHDKMFATCYGVDSKELRHDPLSTHLPKPAAHAHKTLLTRAGICGIGHHHVLFHAK